MAEDLVIKNTLIFSILMLAVNAHAFQILSAISNPCHENMTLSVFGYGPGEFLAAPTSEILMNRFVSKVNEIGVPQDSATQAIIKEMTNRFHWQGLDLATRYVLTSLVAGARMPDTRGFSVIDIDHIRDNHLTDSAQATHMLRSRANDGQDGNMSAITQTRLQITNLVNSVLTDWSAGGWTTSQTWAFAFYGEQSVQLFSAAFNLGQVAHSIEDSYSHTIRDDQFNILSVANYIESMSDNIDEARDGPPHSDRLDQCNMNDAFDSLRVFEARKQVSLVFNQIDSLLSQGTTNDSSVETLLNSTFIYKPGCGYETNYCGSVWIAKSREQISEPYKLGYNCALVKSIDRGGPPTLMGPRLPLIAWALLLSPVFVAFALKRLEGFY